MNDFQKEILKSTAKSYFDDNINTTSIGNTYIVFIQKDLVDNGYLEEFNDSQGNPLYGKITLEITKNNNVITKVKATTIETSSSNIEN